MNMINTEKLCLGCMSDNNGEEICPFCGYDSSSRNPENCLPVKFVINNRFLVGKALKANGEGITYIGWDNGEDAVITIKEYFPKGFANRNPDKTVSMTEAGKYTFNEGLIEFMEINRKIMRSDLPSLVPVIDVFEENGTVYAVSSNIPGITLSDFLKRNGDTLKWEQARALFLPLIDTVKGMNDLGIIHGGISDETIIVGRDGKLRISDYSIKKLRMRTSEIEERIYPGFAAIEQYDVVGLHIDSYTDVYALSATLLKVFIGTAPAEALARLQNDSMSVPAKFAEELPRHVLSALANGLQVMPKSRTKDIETFKNELVYGEIATPTVKTNSDTLKQTEIDKNSNKMVKEKQKSSSAKYAIISSVCTALVFVIIAGVLYFTVFKKDNDDKETQSSEPTTSYVEPEVDEIGDIDSDAAVSAKLYPVSDYTGKYYSDILKTDDNDIFEFSIKGKEFSDKYPVGAICRQTVKAGSEAERDTKIQFVISLGPQKIKIANLSGLTEMEAKLELLKQGFLYDNIIVEEKYDEDREPSSVLDQSPKYGESVSNDEAVTIYINSYEGENPEDENSSDNGIYYYDY